MQMLWVLKSIKNNSICLLLTFVLLYKMLLYSYIVRRWHLVKSGEIIVPFPMIVAVLLQEHSAEPLNTQIKP